MGFVVSTRRVNVNIDFKEERVLSIHNPQRKCFRITSLKAKNRKRDMLIVNGHTKNNCV
jgi:calcineurin-like phosphoesterase family protein